VIDNLQNTDISISGKHKDWLALSGGRLLPGRGTRVRPRHRCHTR